MVTLATRPSGSLGMVRLLQSFGNTPLPVGFVASQLGMSEDTTRERIAQLVEQNVLTTDGGTVALVR